MIDTPEIVTTDAKRTAVIRLRIPREEIKTVMGPAIGEVMSVVRAQGLTPAGPVFARHFSVDPKLFDFEVGVPVNRDASPSGRVEAGELPAVTVARTVYFGPYEGLRSAWEEFEAWMKKEGHAGGTELWESYTSGPESGADSSKWRTELVRPVKV